MSGIYGSEWLSLPVPWLAWLAGSEVRVGLYAMRGLYGVLRFLHLLSMAGFLGLVLLVDLRGLGVLASGSLQPIRPHLGAMVSWSFLAAVITGLALFLRDPLGAGLHSMFLPKLILVAAGYGLARWVRRLAPVRERRALSRAGAALSLCLWVSVVGASTWNHVERPARPGEAMRLHTLGR